MCRDSLRLGCPGSAVSCYPRVQRGGACDALTGQPGSQSPALQATSILVLDTFPSHPIPFPLPTATLPRRPLPPRTNKESPEEAEQRVRETQWEVAGQGRPRAPKMVQSVEGGKGRDKKERIIVVVRSPCQEKYPADAHTSVHKSVLEPANPAWTRSVHLDAPGQRHGQQPASGQPTSE